MLEVGNIEGDEEKDDEMDGNSITQSTSEGGIARPDSKLP